ncbi:hypothetical protein D3C72_2222310 [compost metagenome]
MVRCGNRLKFWNTMPMCRTPLRRRELLGLSDASMNFSPNSRMSPVSMLSRPLTVRISDVLPEPDGPMIETTWPYSTFRSMPSNTLCVP